MRRENDGAELGGTGADASTLNKRVVALAGRMGLCDERGQVRPEGVLQWLRTAASGHPRGLSPAQAAILLGRSPARVSQLAVGGELQRAPAGGLDPDDVVRYVLATQRPVEGDEGMTPAAAARYLHVAETRIYALLRPPSANGLGRRPELPRLVRNAAGLVDRASLDALAVAMARRSETDKERLEAFATGDYPTEVRAAAASNAKISLRTLRRLATSPEPEIRAAAARNERLPVELAKGLLGDEDPRVQAALGQNPAIPDELRAQAALST